MSAAVLQPLNERETETSMKRLKPQKTKKPWQSIYLNGMTTLRMLEKPTNTTQTVELGFETA